MIVFPGKKRTRIALVGRTLCIAVQLTHGKECLVDEGDLDYVSKYHWRAQKSKSGWYAVRRFKKNGKTFTIRMHRELLNCPDELEVHHCNGDTLDNRLENLLPCTDDGHKILHMSKLSQAKNEGIPTMEYPIKAD